MNVSHESVPSSTPYAERIEAGLRWLRRHTIAVRLEVRRLESPRRLRPELLRPGNIIPQDEKAGEVGSDRLQSPVKAVTRFLREARQTWRSMTLPFPEPRVRLIPADDIQQFETAIAALCENFRQQASQPPLNSTMRVTHGRRQLSDLLVGPASTSDLFFGSFAVRWDYPSLEPDPRLEPLAPELYQEEKQRASERLRRAAEEVDALLLAEFLRLTNQALELVKDQGQRTLIALTSKDLHQEVNAPTCHTAFHDVTLLAGMLLDHAQCQPT